MVHGPDSTDTRGSCDECGACDNLRNIACARGRDRRRRACTPTLGGCAGAAAAAAAAANAQLGTTFTAEHSARSLAAAPVTPWLATCSRAAACPDPHHGQDLPPAAGRPRCVQSSSAAPLQWRRHELHTAARPCRHSNGWVLVPDNVVHSMPEPVALRVRATPRHWYGTCRVRCHGHYLTAARSTQQNSWRVRGSRALIALLTYP